MFSSRVSRNTQKQKLFANFLSLHTLFIVMFCKLQNVSDGEMTFLMGVVMLNSGKILLSRE